MKILQKALTFDDVLLVPSYSEILPRHTQLQSRLTKKIKLNIPFISAAMDTVTESKLAIAMAQAGGIGIIHKNLSPFDQANEVIKVKRYESGVVRDPVTVDMCSTIREVVELSKEHGISGFPVVDQKKLVGIVTNRDLRFETRLHALVYEIMTPRERLVTIREGSSLMDARILLHAHRLERVLVVNEKFELRGLITVKDIEKAEAYPEACKDHLGKLRVGAAIGISHDTDDRMERLMAAGVDVVVVDTAHGHSQGVLTCVKRLRTLYPDLQIIAGNIATAEAALALVAHGADAVKVGIGPGSICTTRIVAGVGVPQITAINNIANALSGQDIPIIADGGIRYSGDVAKAFAAGAHAVMMGGIFAGTTESPGEVFLYQGRSYKAYRGMGSVGAMKNGAADRYFQDGYTNVDKLVPEGIEGRVAYKGSVVSILAQFEGGLRASMGYCGCRTIGDLRNASLVEITHAGIRESHVHDVQITKEAPNYQVK